MKLSEFIEKYGDCEVTEEMEKFIEKPKGKWMPGEDDRYYYINSAGIVECAKYCNISHASRYRRDFLRIFKTKEEAERYREIMKACKEASFEPDWEDYNQHKAYLYYDYVDKHIYVTTRYSCNGGEPFFFESHDIVVNLIERFGEKDIAKYVLGVEVD